MVILQTTQHLPLQFPVRHLQPKVGVWLLAGFLLLVLTFLYQAQIQLVLPLCL